MQTCHLNTLDTKGRDHELKAHWDTDNLYSLYSCNIQAFNTSQVGMQLFIGIRITWWGVITALTPSDSNANKYGPQTLTHRRKLLPLCQEPAFLASFICHATIILKHLILWFSEKSFHHPASSGPYLTRVPFHFYTLSTQSSSFQTAPAFPSITSEVFLRSNIHSHTISVCCLCPSPQHLELRICTDCLIKVCLPAPMRPNWAL